MRTLEELTNETWLGLGKIGKIHFVYNRYSCAMRSVWFKPIAVYDGYNDQFIVISDFYNNPTNESIRKDMKLLFSIFANDTVTLENISLIYNNNNLVTNTEELGLKRKVEIVRVHSNSMSKNLDKYLFGEKND